MVDRVSPAGPTRYKILLGDEEIEFEGPGGLTESQIATLAEQQLKSARPGEVFETPYFAGPFEAEPAPEITEQVPWEDMTYLQRVAANAEGLGEAATGFVQGAAQGMDRAANLLEGGYNATLGHVFGQSESADTPAFQNLAAQLGEGDPGAQTAGRWATAALLTRGMGAGAAGATGGLLESDADTFSEGAIDAALGFAGGKVAEPIVKGVGSAIAPIVDESAEMLHRAGVRLTPGQALPALREAEDKMMSWPFVGSQIRKGRQQSFEDFSRAPLDDALREATGKTLPKTVKSGQQAIKFTGDKLSAEYDALIPKLSFRQDAQLLQEVQALGQKLQGPDFTPATRQRFEAMVRDGVMSRFKGPVGTGEEFQAADKYLSARISRFGASTDPDHQALAEAFKELQGSLSGALARSNPQQAAKLDALNKGWALLVPAESAGAMAKGGVFSPNQYRTAIRQNDKRVRKRGTARGEAVGQALAEAGSEILPSQYPNSSGTAGHEAYSLGNMRFWQGLGARPVYNAMNPLLVNAAMFPRPEALTKPIAELVKTLPAASAGGMGAVNALSPIFTINPNQ